MIIISQTSVKGDDLGKQIFNKLSEIASNEATPEIRLEDTGTPAFLNRTQAKEEAYIKIFTGHLEGAGAEVKRIHNTRGDLFVNDQLCELRLFQKKTNSKSASVGLRKPGQQVCNPNRGKQLN